MTTTETSAKPNGDKANQGKLRPTLNKPHVISDPNDVASLVLMQVDAVNAKKDELTIVIKGLADLAKQLVRVYAQNAQAIKKLQMRIQALEKEQKNDTNKGSSTIAVTREILYADNDIGPIHDTNGAETLRGLSGKEWLQSDGAAILLKHAA